MSAATLASAFSPAPLPLRIGTLTIDPPILQAPMAGYTNYAFREMVRGFGFRGLLATEMISARGFVERERRFEEYPDRLWGVREEPRPLAVQIWDNDPAVLAAVGAKLVEEFRASVVDINFGCPVRQVTERARSGSYLLRFPERVGQIVARVVAACRPTPVTAKIRLGCTRDTMTAIDVAQAVEGAGGAALTVHGRTAADLFRGTADWERIAAVRPHLARIPLIGNGDLTTAEAVAAAFRYGVDGVMIGRAGLGRPWLFAQAQAALRGEPVFPDPPLSGQRTLLVEHYGRVIARFGIAKGTSLMRKYACCYAQARPGARHFRAAVSTVNTPAEFYRVVEEHFPRDEPASLMPEC